MFNLSKKDFLLGVGTGLVISGILVSFFGTGQLPDEEIKAGAAKTGIMQKQEITRDKQQGLSEDPNNSGKIISTDGSVSGTGENKAAKKNNADSTKKPAPVNIETPKPKPVKDVIIEIKSGMGSETIARMLEEKGVIKSRDEFYKVVTAHKAHSRFKVGKFTVPAGGDMEEILDILTGK